MPGFIFLASPYTHASQEERNARYLANERAILHYFKKGAAIYSPIVHWHSIADRHGLAFSYEIWQHQNDDMLREARSLHILELDGWLISKGVEHEIAVALDVGIPCYLISPWKDYSARLLKDALA